MLQSDVVLEQLAAMREEARRAALMPRPEPNIPFFLSVSALLLGLTAVLSNLTDRRTSLAMKARSPPDL